MKNLRKIGIGLSAIVLAGGLVSFGKGLGGSLSEKAYIPESVRIYGKCKVKMKDYELWSNPEMEVKRDSVLNLMSGIVVSDKFKKEYTEYRIEFARNHQKAIYEMIYGLAGVLFGGIGIGKSCEKKKN